MGRMLKRQGAVARFEFARVAGLLAACVLCLCVGNRGAEAAEEPRAIVQGSFDLMRGTHSEVEMKMSVIRPNWTRSMSIKTWTLGEDYTLVLVTAPARDKGNAFLERKNELWNWFPAIERTIKIPPSMMLQSWMGSDFTNEDMVKETSLVTQYTHKLLRNESVDGELCYMIEATPKPAAPAVWGKVIVWISKSGKYQRRITYYDEDGKLNKTLSLSRVKRMDDRVVPTFFEMTPAGKPGQKTQLEYITMNFTNPIAPSFFSQQNLRKLH